MSVPDDIRTGGPAPDDPDELPDGEADDRWPEADYEREDGCCEHPDRGSERIRAVESAGDGARSQRLSPHRGERSGWRCQR